MAQHGTTQGSSGSTSCLAPHGTHSWDYRIRQLMFDEDSTQLDQLLEVLDVVGLC